MNFGESVVGALVGAVVGAGAHIGIELALGEATWFPLVTGLLTGIGVRQLDSSVTQSASYLRGAVAAIIALVGIFGGVQSASYLKMSRLQAELESIPPRPEPEPLGEETADDAEEPAATDAEAVADPAPATAGPAVAGGTESAPPIGPADGFSVWNFVMIGVGAFFAYELARGSVPASQTANSREEESSAAADADPQAGAPPPENSQGGQA
ncbi:MAG: hypothetical protein AAGB00_06120 [Planctomycetota bacterium]